MTRKAGLEYIVTNAQDAACLIDLNYNYQKVSDYYLELLQTTVEQIIGRNIAEIHGDDYFQQLRPCLEQTTAGNPCRWQTQIEHPTRGILYFELRFDPVFDDNYQVTGIIGYAHDITYLKRIEQALRGSEQRYRDLAEGSFQGIFVLQAGAYKFVNRAYAALLGYSVDELLMLEYPEQVYAIYDRELVRSNCAVENLDVTVASSYEVDVVRKNDSMITVQHLVKPVNWYGEPAAQVTVLDITARKNMEMDLRRSERVYRELVETDADVFVYRWLPDTTLTFVNQPFCRFLNLTLEQLIGRRWLYLRAEEELAAAREYIQYLLKSRRKHTDERKITLNNGEQRWVRWTSTPIFDDDGELIEFLSIGFDVTDRHLAEQALAEERNLLRSLIDNIPDTIYVKDQQARFVLNNLAGTKQLGASSSDELLGKTVFDYYPKSEAEEFFEDDQNVIKNGAIIHNKEEQVIDYSSLESVWLSTSKIPLRDTGGDIIGLVGIGRDITQAKQLAEQLHYQANHDALTGLVNRHQFEQQLQKALLLARLKNRVSVLCYIDLDQFKIVNDTAGHYAGDQLLKQVTKLLSERVDKADTLARLGGDEFGLLLTDCSLAQAQVVAERLVKQLKEFRFTWKDQVFAIGASVGIVSVTAQAEDLAELLLQADIACYRAKDLGRNRAHVYHHKDHELSKRRSELLHAAGIREALEKGRFSLYGQAIVLLNDDELPIQQYEILLRMRDANGDLLLPGAFIPVAERYGLIGNIDHWVIRSALSQVARISNDANAQISINLSAYSLNDDTFLDFVAIQLDASDLQPGQLCFEISETAVVNNLSQAMHFIKEMKKLGCCFALDDFGSGLSSFSYLKHLPVDYIKIDGSVVQDIVDDTTDRAMVAAINQVSHVLGIKTVAKFVENEQIIQILRELNIDYAQGYAIDKPKLLR